MPGARIWSMARLRSAVIGWIAVLTLAGSALAAPPKSLQERIAGVLAVPDLARGFWGLEVTTISSGQTLYSLNSEKLFTLASNTKLFTTAAALALIGPDYKFHTTVETTGVIDKYGRPVGDVNPPGRGAPTLSGRTLPYSLRTERKLPPLHVLDELADQIV